MSMDDEIWPALRQDLIDRFEPAQIWDDDDYDAVPRPRLHRVSFRLAFEIQQTRHLDSIRSVRYVDVWIENGIIGCQAHDRQTIKVDYCEPDSLDRLYEFIGKRSKAGMERILSKMRR